MKVIRKNTGSSSQNNDVNYEALREKMKLMERHVFETANLEEGETLKGYITGIVDLGLQPQPDARAPKKDGEDEEDWINKYEGTYYENMKNEKGAMTRYRRWPQKPQHSIAIAVDFPDIIVDKGQFFGESSPKPLRVWMGGDAWDNDIKRMVLARPISLQERKCLDNGKVWSLPPAGMLYKMALNAKIISSGEAFKAEQVDELLGKTFQFKLRIFYSEHKGNEYYNERINFVSGLGRGMEPFTDTETFLISSFGKEEGINQENAIKELRASVINTLTRMDGWEDSPLKAEVKEFKRDYSNSSGSSDSQESSSTKDSSKPKPKKVTRKKDPEPVSEIVEDDVPEEDWTDDNIPF